jgi:RHS repeat-associated protein
MKCRSLSSRRSTSSRSIRILTLVLCYALVSPCFAGLAFSIGTNNTRMKDRVNGWSYQPLPTPTPTDGVRQLTPGPYVPPALRTDKGERRAKGREGRRVEEPPVKRGSPALNLPDLGESRKTRKSPVTKRGQGNTNAQGSSQTSDSSETGCGDCDSGERAGAGGRGPYFDAARSSATSMPIQEQLPIECADCDPGGRGGAGGSDPYFGTARTRPTNETGDPGVTLGSRNFNWSMPLVSLPGRGGLDISISLFYNSLVWTKQGNSIEFNADHGSPAPGFQIGLPRLQAQFFDTDDNSYAYIMITPSGGRVEMKQVGFSGVYESADSTYTQLTFSDNTPIVRTTDGTQYIFGTQVSAEWRCTKIEDRNGNYISATYDISNGHILTITDTLSRVLNFNYDGDNNLSTITQTWGSDTHSWVTFIYTPVQMSFNFSGLTAYGATNGGSQTVLSYIAFPENTSYHFDYNSYGQVYQIRHKAPDGHELEHTFYNLDNPGTQTDCPRFTERHDNAQDWNGGNDAVTSYAVTDSATWTNPESGASQTGTLLQETSPDGTIYKEYSHASGWDSGLTQLSEFWSGGVKKKWISMAWTQDNLTLTYPQNPRVSETNIYDDASNRQRTTIEYNQGYSLPTHIREYSGSDGQAFLRLTAMAYKWDSEYFDRRIIGLPFERLVYDGPTGHLMTRQIYHYDWGDNYFSTQQPSTNYDVTNYPSWFVAGRGNLTAVRRYNCADDSAAYDDNQAVWIQLNGYNMAGSNIWTADASGHTTNINYGDNFSDSTRNQNTLAFPTTVTDPDGYSSSAQYNYDFGAITRTHVPTSGVAPNITYLDVVREYDDFGRFEKATNQTNGAYTRVVYENNANYVHTYQTLIDLTQANEFHSWQVFDGAGRVRASASDHPGSTGGLQGQYVIYNNIGRIVEQSNPTEINGSWIPSGDDAAGWRVTQQSYDWIGRPIQTTNSDGTTRVISYGGCGCAGGEVATAQDEHGRQRRYTKDSLGRLRTVEEMVWNTGNVYSTTTYDYNARDQIIEINQNGQQPHRTFSYDGHGRLRTRTTPEQGTTTYNYNPDDTTNAVTDARRVTTSYGYNNRHQVTSLAYNVTGDPTGQTAATANVSFAYDAAGNRTSMSDGLGSASYVFNNLGQMASETRTFTGLGSYSLSYEYNLAGELKKVTNPWSAEVSYGYDRAGRLQSVGGANYAGVSNYASALSYRAFGAIKGMNYGDGHTLTTAYDNRLRPATWNVSNVLGYNYAYDYFGEHTGRVTYAQSIYDGTLDRSYEYDNVGRLAISHSGAEARAHAYSGQWGTLDGPYSQGYDYDVWGNVTHKYGWGGEVQGGSAGQSSDIYYAYTGNRRNGIGYDAAGNVTNDGTQTYLYDATGQQTYASGLGAGGSAPTFTDDPLVSQVIQIRLVHLTELRAAVNQLRTRASLSAATWSTDPNPQQQVTTVKADHIRQLRSKLEEALNALHLSVGSYAHATLTEQSSPIYAVDFQELRDKIKGAWSALASSSSVAQSYDGDGLRVKKIEYGWTTFYLRSSVLGGQVIAEIDGNAVWQRGYVYAGNNLMAVQEGGVFWTYQDPVTKSKRVCDVNGNIVSSVELDPWGADTNRSSNSAFQPKKFTSYNRDSSGTDEAMFRRYNRKHSRFDQPDPYNGSYSLTDPQSFNRYAYVQNDPVNFADPTGLCTFNITINGVTNGTQLRAMQNEISRIFGAANQTVIFNQASAAGINSNTSFTLNVQQAGNPDHPDAPGWTPVTIDSHGTASVTGSGFASTDVLTAAIQRSSDSALRMLGMTSGNFGLALGRVAAHEAGHHFLQIIGKHPSQGLMQQYGADWWRTGSSYESRFRFTSAQAQQLSQLCPQAPRPSTTNNELLHGIGGVRDGIGPVTFGYGYPSWWDSLQGFLDFVNSIPVGGGYVTVSACVGSDCYASTMRHESLHTR